jgi:hypothetical protein
MTALLLTGKAEPGGNWCWFCVIGDWLYFGSWHGVKGAVPYNPAAALLLVDLNRSYDGLLATLLEVSFSRGGGRKLTLARWE